ANNVAALKDYFVAKAPIYPALRGLANFYEFIIIWTNINTNAADSELVVGETHESFKDIFEDDSAILGELNSYVQHPNIKDRIINCLLGVDGSYTKVFNGKVLGETFSETDKADLIANATGKYGFKANFQNSLELCVYDPL